MGDIPNLNTDIDYKHFIRAGKFRRYHQESLRQLLDLSTVMLNIRDIFFVLDGIIHSYFLLKKIKPDILFIKGGFVGVPVGLMAATLRIPYITHDSDAVPGLANRLIARWAKLHTVAMPAELYHYPRSKTISVGIPVSAEYKPVSSDLKIAYKEELNINRNNKVIFIVGGGLGSTTINQAVSQIMQNLLLEFKDLVVFQGVGRANEEQIKDFYNHHLSEGLLQRLNIFGYRKDIFRLSGASDVIVTRAGATNLAEFSIQLKACIIIPSAFLTAGHQLKNADLYKDHQAAIIISEKDLQEDPNRLAKEISELLKDTGKQELLGQNISKLAKPNATRELASIILLEANKS